SKTGGRGVPPLGCRASPARDSGSRPLGDTQTAAAHTRAVPPTGWLCGIGVTHRDDLGGVHRGGVSAPACERAPALPRGMTYGHGTLSTRPASWMDRDRHRGGYDRLRWRGPRTKRSGSQRHAVPGLAGRASRAASALDGCSHANSKQTPIYKGGPSGAARCMSAVERRSTYEPLVSGSSFLWDRFRAVPSG